MSEMKRLDFELVGKSFPRSDGVARVTGAEKYTVDVSLPRMLHGRIVSSPYAHAIVKSIDTSAAASLPLRTITTLSWANPARPIRSAV